MKTEKRNDHNTTKEHGVYSLHDNTKSILNISSCSRGQSEIRGLFLNFASSPRKKTLVAIMSCGHVLGSYKTMFDKVFGCHNSGNGR